MIGLENKSTFEIHISKKKFNTHKFKISKEHTENSSDRVSCFGRLVNTIDMVETFFKK